MPVAIRLGSAITETAKFNFKRVGIWMFTFYRNISLRVTQPSRSRFRKKTNTTDQREKMRRAARSPEDEKDITRSEAVSGVRNHGISSEFRKGMCKSNLTSNLQERKLKKLVSWTPPPADIVTKQFGVSYKANFASAMTAPFTLFIP